MDQFANRTSASRSVPVSDAHLYRPFIDGLRAISIVAVVAYHIGLPGFPGGYVGVDIFFVISGYLIINQIRSGLEQDRFAIWQFYARRCLRILPPFFLMLLAVELTAPFILPTPPIQSGFAQSVALAPWMVTNALFFSQQNYFDLTAYEKPLLHTWTLSVEEQFYLFAPILLLLLFHAGGRRFGKPAAAVAIVLALLSFAGAIHWTVTDGRNAAFYLPHLRAWEFIAGGLIVPRAVNVARRLPSPAIELQGWVGAGLIATAVVAFDSTTPYPSWRAALPVAGAVLIILGGLSRPEAIFARLLALRGMVAIGLVSYSWYLWHWPLLSFAHILASGEPPLLWRVLSGGVAGFVLAIASWRWVELPVRRWRERQGRFARPVMIVAGGLAACLIFSAAGGSAGYVDYQRNKAEIALRYGPSGRDDPANGCQVGTRSALAGHCTQRPFGLLVGDSHAVVMAGALARAVAPHGLTLAGFARGLCDPLALAPAQRQKPAIHDHCTTLASAFTEAMARHSAPRLVIVTARWEIWKDVTPDRVADFVEQFDPARTRILLIGPVPTFKRSALGCVVLSDRFHLDRTRCTRDRAAIEAERAAPVAALRAAAARFANVRYLDPIDQFCDARICSPFKGDSVWFEDYDHLSKAGAAFVATRFAGDLDWAATPPSGSPATQ